MAAALLAFGTTGWRAAHYQSQQLQGALEGRDVVVVGTVADLPQWSADGTRFALAVDQATLNGEPVPMPQRIALGWYVKRAWGQSVAPAAEMGSALPSPDEPAATQDATNPSPPPRCTLCVYPGERWRMTVRLKQPHGNRNPFGFDYELWLWEQGVGGAGYVRDGEKDTPAQRLASAGWYDLPAMRDALRLRVREAVYQQVAPSGAGLASDAAPDRGAASRQRQAGVIAALLMGDQSAIERSDWDVFRVTGVAHLMSISGLHITLFAWLAGAIVGGLWRSTSRWRWPLCLWWPAPHAALWGGVALAAAHAWFSGWGVPAQRTVIMLLVVAALRSRGRQWPWHAVWALAAVAVLARDPWALMQAGFWLSFVAVAVLFATGRPRHNMHGNWLVQLRRSMAKFVHAQWVVLLALSPLTLLLFGQVSLVGFFANAVAVPVVTLLITPLAMLGVLWPPLWQLAAIAVDVLMLCLQWMAALPWANHRAAVAPLWVGVAGLLGGVMLALRLPMPLRLAGALGLLPLVLWQAPRPVHGQFDLLAADIGQGSAVLVRTQRHSLLFDAGPQYSAQSDAGQRVLLPLLAALDERPDWLVLSHHDTDHVGGAAALIAQQPDMQVLGAIEDGHPLHQLRPIMRCAAGQTWQWDGVDFEVLHPLAQDYAAGNKTNAMSCVLRISNGTRSALLTGDAESAQEQAIVARQFAAGASLQADLLVAGHHGSKTSSSAVWLDAVKPRWTLIQQGYRNRYHHPHPTVLQRLRQAGSQIVQSDTCGAAWWTSATNGVTCEREEHRRYWQHGAADGRP